MQPIITGVRNSLTAIKAPRFFESERGFQGELLVQLARYLVCSENTIIEQEHQKRLLAHDLKIRPDIIVHEPFDPNFHRDRTQGNFAAIELKLNASPKDALDDLTKLSSILQTLQYPIGFFINIASKITYSNLVPNEVQGRIVCFAVSLEGNTVNLIEERA